MARNRNLFKLHVNLMLDRLQQMAPGERLGSEAELAEALSVSRTTVRAVLAHLAGAGILDWEGREKVLRRLPEAADWFEESETLSHQAHVESQFLDWVLRGDPRPNTVLSEAGLARRFGVNVASVREFLIRFEPFGLIEKQPNRHWVLKGFTRGFAEEMFTVREMFERKALAGMMNACGPGGERAGELQALSLAHQALASGPDEGLDAFPQLDAAFHQLLCASSGNRFIIDFSRTISIIVHFHYRWNKRDEQHRNRAAISEHIAIIEAVQAGDAKRAEAALDAHLATARRTLMASVIWPEDTAPA
ncbi:FCD domain-containing protein [Pannonibacter indicus]|uniref:GntR family transcriptional regulator n=1 Tax=Pannonibacter indicus TaxID=466044 RepID=UPI0035B18354